MLRGRMWDLDLVVSRATVVAIVAVALLAIYVAVVVALGRLLPGEGVSQVVAAGAVAVAVQPVRLWATTRVRRLVHGLAADPAQAVRRLGAEIGRDDDDLLPGLARSLAEAMRLSAVRVVAEDRQTELARWVRPGLGPDPLLDPAEVTLEHRGVVVGHLLVSVPPARRSRPATGACSPTWPACWPPPSPSPAGPRRWPGSGTRWPAPGWPSGA
ncbi:hypothetical protein [Nocardioides daphniae]|uniref:hypothetical protein n=1 Tax=Nocardioides daphniae TaxID=402297 RepID=UPI001931024F|nr:hypothetical protein [Nocardioides daphniae]